MDTEIKTYPKLAKAMAGAGAEFPQNLEKLIPRILSRIELLWGEREVINYLDSLLLEDRKGRQGLSEQDLLNCMADFDPKRHGRFGGYLVSRKMITHAQLNEALLHQQGIDVQPVSSTRLTLQDMENFLSGFDPGRDGSIGEYLASHGVITTEQLNNILQQQNLEAESTHPVSELDKPAVASGPHNAEHLWDLFPIRDKLNRAREIVPASETVKPVKQDNQLISEIPSPGIDFDIGSVMPNKPDA